MTSRTPDLGRFELVRIVSLRTAQLMRGCTPRVPAGIKMTTTARQEVAGGRVSIVPRDAFRPLK